MARVIRDGARVVPSEVMDAHAQANRIVREAEARATALVTETRARMEAEARAAAHLEVEAARQAFLEDLEGVVARLAIEVARRVVDITLKADPNLVRALVSEALDRVRRASWVRVRAHPDDVPRLASLRAEVVPDGRLTPGDCVVESELGEVDGRIEVRLEAIAEALTDASE